jgi:hypothetical protein
MVTLLSNINQKGLQNSIFLEKIPASGKKAKLQKLYVVCIGAQTVKQLCMEECFKIHHTELNF